jgi:ERCC4-type nuclease
MIFVDTNVAENFLYEGLSSQNLPVERKRLDLGDVMIQSENLSYVFERKTWSDLQSSICDGRWTEQKMRMTQTEHEVPTQFSYLIEGNCPDWEDAKVQLWPALIKTQVRDNMHVFHCNSKEDSVKLIAYMYKNFMNNGFVPKVSNKVAGMSSMKRKRDNLSTPESVYLAMLSVIPGMSLKKSEAIRQQYPNLTALSHANEKQLSQIKVDDRNLGPMLSKKICQMFFDV